MSRMPWLLAMLGLVCSLELQAGVVVASSESPLPVLDAKATRRLFLGRTPELNGLKITLIYQKAGPAQQAFEARVIEKTHADLRSYWSRLVFTGTAPAPQMVEGDAAVKARVRATPGAVGYIDDAAVDPSLKVLFRY